MPDASTRTAPASLVRRAQAGEAQAVVDLVQRCARAVRAIALAHLGRIADAEDTTQTVLLVAIERLGSCRDPDRFEAWLFAIARNRARRALIRRRLRDVIGIDGPDDAAPGEVDPDTRRALIRALGALSTVQREVVLLHDLEGYTHAEIAGAIRISEEASRQHLSRARRTLRAQLAEEIP